MRISRLPLCQHSSSSRKVLSDLVVLRFSISYGFGVCCAKYNNACFEVYEVSHLFDCSKLLLRFYFSNQNGCNRKIQGSSSVIGMIDMTFLHGADDNVVTSPRHYVTSITRTRGSWFFFEANCWFPGRSWSSKTAEKWLWTGRMRAWALTFPSSSSCLDWRDAARLSTSKSWHSRRTGSDSEQSSSITEDLAGFPWRWAPKLGAFERSCLGEHVAGCGDHGGPWHSRPKLALSGISRDRLRLGYRQKLVRDGIWVLIWKKEKVLIADLC